MKLPWRTIEVGLKTCARSRLSEVRECRGAKASRSDSEDRVFLEERGYYDSNCKVSITSRIQMNASEVENSALDILSIEEALSSLERMSQLHVVENFLCILQACRKKKKLEYAKRLHAFMCKSGLEADRSLGNYLVHMWVQCGSTWDAQQVFNRLPDRNEYSWTSLMMGYIQCGESQFALYLYQEMQEESVHPSKYTFVTVLKACARLEDMERGREIHAEVARKGLERDPFVSNTLVDMYAKCGGLPKAQEVFEKLFVRDVVSWTALITGYAKRGLGEDALNYFKQMQMEGISPNAITFVCSLRACGSIQAIDTGQAIHIEVARKGLERDPMVCSTLVDMYAKCGALPKAQEVFDRLSVRDVVSWNILIAGYVENGLTEEALICLELMQLEGVFPNAATFVCSLKACGSIRATDKCREIHVDIARKGLERDFYVGSSLVDMYAQCGLLARAQKVFDKLTVRDVVPWTALIAGYAEHGLGEEALNCFKQMQLEGVSPNVITFVCTLKACGSMQALDKGAEIHADITRKGLEGEPIVGSTLVDMYAKCGSLAKAREVFDKLPVRDLVSWTVLVAGYSECGFGEEALHCVEQMQLEGVLCNALTFVCSLKACGSTGAIDKGQQIHSEIARQELETDPCVANTLVDMYAKCGLFARARELFNRLPVRDLVSWNALIAGYAQLGQSEVVFNMLQRMNREDIKPGRLTFLTLLLYVVMQV